MKSGALKITLHMVCSLDGFIAKKDNSVSWFETSHNYEKGIEVPGPEDIQPDIDCYVMGSRTYEHALELSKSYGWVYGEKPVIVLTKRKLPIERKNIELYSGDLRKLVHEKLQPGYKNVWVVGGAMLVNAFIQSGLADEIRQIILPILLGEGIRFYEQFRQELAVHLIDVKAYKNGMVELGYSIVNDKPGS